MKKLLILLWLLTLVLAVTMFARAALVTITFDEEYVTSGPTNDRYDGTQVDTQYSFLGVTWVDTVDDDPDILTGQGVTHPGEFNGSWSDTDNMLWNYGQGGGGTTPVNAPILLSFPANSFSFEFRRPQAPSTIDVRLYMGDELVHETIGFSWDPIVDGDWKTFSYSGDPFDKVVLSSGDKFNTDNYSFNMVPIVECDMVPDDIPTFIPRGGTLGFQATVTNNTDSSGMVHFVTFLTPPPPYARYPASGWLDHYTPGLAPYESKSGHISHTIPITWPLGTYVYHGWVGRPGPVIYHQCQFEFEVVEP